MQPQEFVAKWRNVDFGEKQASQEMFLDLCALVDHPSPVTYGDKDAFTFEKWVPGGFADAYLEGHFGWEFKGDDSELDGALNQLLRYQLHLKTPPLLIVSSFRTIRIQTNFPGMQTVRHVIPVAGLDEAGHLETLRRVFHSPDDFRPNRTLDALTRETADLFHSMVRDMEQRDVDPEKLARYLNQIVFCLYSEDAGLLPDGLFTRIIREHNHDPETFDIAVRNLFQQMSVGGLFGADRISYFNGDLFNSVDTVVFSPNAMLQLYEATRKDWRDIEPSIFGTLFERALDASKRSQLGAHYTDASDIALVVEPVVMEPLRREWETAQQEVNALADAGNDASARFRLQAFQDRLASVKVLDPACGSGNFLYTALRSLLDLEKKVIDFNDAQHWEEMVPRVQPSQLLGLEINPYAAELARTALWIGYIQWHLSNGVHYRRQPVLTPMDTIRQTDAILDLSDPDNPAEPEWPAAEFIIGNPPFLGHVPFRKELGDEYVDAVYSLYGTRIPNSSDLCCYWFEKARAQIESDNTRRAGLLATQAIRFQSSRPVLTRIKKTGEIFSAVSDRNWVLDGATVHTSIVCFDDGSQTTRTLDNTTVSNINIDLTSGIDLTVAKRLAANKNIAFQGVGKVGKFEIPESTTLDMISRSNPNGRPNSEVIRRWITGTDIAEGSRNEWIVDFGVDMPMQDATLYEAPFEYINERVRPERVKNKMKWRAENWWLHGYPAKTMRHSLAQLQRFIATPKVAKHRFFVWLTSEMLPSNLVICFAKDDDYTFGILSSYIHELWTRQVGSQLREADSGGTYTPTTCFETFPLPEPDESQRAVIATAAEQLNERRENVLRDDSKQTLTNLYNQRPTWLANAHATLDAAVAAAYGWPADLTDAEILEKLLALNLQRSE